MNSWFSVLLSIAAIFFLSSQLFKRTLDNINGGITTLPWDLRSEGLRDDLRTSRQPSVTRVRAHIWFGFMHIVNSIQQKTAFSEAVRCSTGQSFCAVCSLQMKLFDHRDILFQKAMQ